MTEDPSSLSQKDSFSDVAAVTDGGSTLGIKIAMKRKQEGFKRMEDTPKQAAAQQARFTGKELETESRSVTGPTAESPTSQNSDTSSTTSSAPKWKRQKKPVSSFRLFLESATLYAACLVLPTLLGYAFDLYEHRHYYFYILSTSTASAAGAAGSGGVSFLPNLIVPHVFQKSNNKNTKSRSSSSHSEGNSDRDMEGILEDEMGGTSQAVSTTASLDDDTDESPPYRTLYDRTMEYLCLDAQQHQQHQHEAGNPKYLQASSRPWMSAVSSAAAEAHPAMWYETFLDSSSSSTRAGAFSSHKKASSKSSWLHAWCRQSAIAAVRSAKLAGSKQQQHHLHHFWSPDAGWTDFAIVAAFSLTLACLRVAIVHWTVPSLLESGDDENDDNAAGRKLEALVRCKSIHLLSSDYNASLTPKTIGAGPPTPIPVRRRREIFHVHDPASHNLVPDFPASAVSSSSFSAKAIDAGKMHSDSAADVGDGYGYFGASSMDESDHGGSCFNLGLRLDESERDPLNDHPFVRDQRHHRQDEQQGMEEPRPSDEEQQPALVEETTTTTFLPSSPSIHDYLYLSEEVHPFQEAEPQSPPQVERTTHQEGNRRDTKDLSGDADGDDNSTGSVEEGKLDAQTSLFLQKVSERIQASQEEMDASSDGEGGRGTLRTRREERQATERLYAAPRYATAVFRLIYCTAATSLALYYFSNANFWPWYVGGSGATANCWDLSGGLSLGMDSDFDHRNSVLRMYFLWQASYHWHSGAFHVLSMIILLVHTSPSSSAVPATSLASTPTRSGQTPKPSKRRGRLRTVRTSTKAYFRSLGQHALAITLIATVYVFSSLRRLGAIGLFAFDVSSWFLHLLQICINAPDQSPWKQTHVIRNIHAFLVIPSYIIARFCIWPALWYSIMFESQGWLKQLERTLVPGAAIVLTCIINLWMVLLMGMSIVYFRRLLYHPHLQRLLRK